MSDLVDKFCGCDENFVPTEREIRQIILKGFCNVLDTMQSPSGGGSIDTSNIEALLQQLVDRPEVQTLCDPDTGQKICLKKNLDGTTSATILGTTTAYTGDVQALVPCGQDYESKSVCFQSIADSSIRYEQVLFSLNGVIDSNLTVWFDGEGNPVAAPTGIERCDVNTEALLQQILDAITSEADTEFLDDYCYETQPQTGVIGSIAGTDDVTFGPPLSQTLDWTNNTGQDVPITSLTVRALSTGLGISAFNAILNGVANTTGFQTVTPAYVNYTFEFAPQVIVDGATANFTFTGSNDILFAGTNAAADANFSPFNFINTIEGEVGAATQGRAYKVFADDGATFVEYRDRTTDAVVNPNDIITCPDDNILILELLQRLLDQAKFPDKVQCFQVPGGSQTISGSEAADWVLIPGELEIRTVGGNQAGGGPFVNAVPGNLEWITDQHTSFGNWQTTFQGSGGPSLFTGVQVRNADTQNAIPVSFSSFSGGPNTQYLATATIVSPEQNFKAYPDAEGGVVYCDELGNIVTGLPIGAVQVKCPEDRELLQLIADRLVTEIECERKYFSQVASLINTDNVIDVTASPIGDAIKLFPDETGLVNEISIRILNNGSDPAGVPFTLNVTGGAIDNQTYSLDPSSVASGPLGPIEGNLPPGRYDVVFPISPPLEFVGGQEYTLTRVEGAEPLVFWTSNTESDGGQTEFLPFRNGEFPQLTLVLDAPDLIFRQCFYNDGTSQFFDCFSNKLDELPSGANPICAPTGGGSASCDTSCGCENCEGEPALTCPRDIVLTGPDTWVAPVNTVSYTITSFAGSTGTYTNPNGDEVPLLPAPGLASFSWDHERDENTLLIKPGVSVTAETGDTVAISWNELCTEGE